MSNLDYSYFKQHLTTEKDFYLFCDNDNYDILYMNEAMCEYLELRNHDYIGKKCYNVVYNRNSPCPYCVASELTDGNYNSIEVNYPLKGMQYDCKISLINYKNKSIRINQYCFNDENNKTQGVEIEDNKILDSLMHSIALGEFVVYFQPKYNIEDVFIGAEALVRRIEPITDKLIMPVDFILLYENLSIIKKLDLEVFEQVCEFQSNWIKLGKSIVIDVNVSTLTLNVKDIANKFKAICDKYNVPCNLFCIGINDDANLTKYIDLISSNVNDLISFGFSIGIDNFGYEHTNISNLVKMNFNEVKFSKLLLKNIETDEYNQNLVRNFIDMCNQLSDISIVAIGIESKECEDFIKSVKPTSVQGYLYSRPMSGVDLFNKFLS